MSLYYKYLSSPQRILNLSTLDTRVSLDKLDLLLIIFISYLFKCLFVPDFSATQLNTLLNFGLFDSISNAIHTNPVKLLFPMSYFSYEVRYFWWTTSVVPLYVLFKIFSPFNVYFILNSVLCIVAHQCAWRLTGSRYLSAILCILFAFGTQLSYGFTYFIIFSYYLLLVYISINLYFVISILKGQLSRKASLYFMLSLILCLIGHEMCLNYVFSLVCLLLYIAYWSKCHKKSIINFQAKKLITMTLSIVFIYIIIQILCKSTHSYFRPGAEEELIFNHTNIFLIIDDLIINFFTFLYMALSNYLPGFLFFSNSISYVGEAQILASQNGYHPTHTQLSYMSYLLEWRFLAGALCVLFVMQGMKWIRRSFREKDNIHALILSLLYISVITGFSTHLLIKVRPYNITPMLTYKAMFSVYAFTILMAYWLENYIRKNFNDRKKIILILLISYMGVVSVSRPATMNAGLAAGGLAGYEDPIKGFQHFFKKN